MCGVRPSCAVLTMREFNKPLLICHYPIIVRGNIHLIRQVLCNLLSNSCRYTPDGGKVTISLTSHNQNTNVRIVNEGIKKH